MKAERELKMVDQGDLLQFLSFISSTGRNT
jgi:hypothetical protein